MLAYVLAWVVGLGSLALYLAAFFFPEVHRKNDFILSGIGMFYALVLWVCAGRITGGLLLGQIASVVVLGWLGWETVNLRRGIVPTDEQTALPSAETIQTALSNLTKPETLSALPGQVMGGVNTFVGRVQEAIAAGAKAKQAASKPVDTYVPLKREDFAEAAKTAQTVVEKAIATTAETTVSLGEAAESILSETPVSLSEAAVEAVETVAETAASLGQATEQTLEETLAAAVKAVESVPTVIPSAPALAAPTVPRPEVRSPVPKASPTAGTSLPSQVLGTIAGIAASLPAMLQKFTKKKESQPIYVRKQFRPDEAAAPADAEGTVDVDGKPTKPGTGTEVAAGVVTAAVVAAAIVTTVQEPVPETTQALAEEPATEGPSVDLLAESTAELVVEPEIEAIADLPIELDLEPPIVTPEMTLDLASAEADDLALTDEPPAEPPVEPLTDVALANLVQDLFQSLDVNVDLGGDLAGTTAMPTDSTVEADTAAMELYETADGTATDGTATTVNLGTPDPTPGTPNAPDDEFGDQWSGSQIPTDEPELPIDPPFMDE